jgi:hypothetical protein
VSTAGGMAGIRPPPDCLSAFQLTPEQRVIAERPSSFRQLVLAGPGTGKTHVVAARLTHLVLAQGLKPHSQIVLLSYTRTAAREMRARMSEAGRLLHARVLNTVELRTMDSYAFMLHDAADVPRPSGGYQAGMESAVRLLQESEAARKSVAELKHVIVDEAQDLFGVRYHFIRSLLTACGGGFTVCADPNQAIYEYLLYEDGTPEDAGFETLRKWLVESQRATVAEMHGSKRHRGEVAKMVRRAEAHLDDASLDWAARWSALSGLLKESGTLQKADLKDTIGGLEGRTAILTRTNGEALTVSEYLHDLEEPIVHELIGPPSPFQVPGWIGRILPQLPNRFDGEDVNGAWGEFVEGRLDSVRDSDEAFRRLALVAGTEPSSPLERTRIERRIRQPWTLPQEILLGAQERVPLVVSTVHRAKGREFDNVIFVEPRPGRAEMIQGTAQLPMEVRVLYVAMTRPKVRISLVHFRSPADTLDKERGKEKRWFVRAWNRGMPAKVELRPDDIDPFSTIPEESAQTLQDRIWSMGGVDGLQARSNPYTPGRWDLTMLGDAKENELLARFTPEFGRVARAVSAKAFANAQAGRRLSNVWMDDVATFTSESPFQLAQGLDPGIIKRGYWLTPVVRGLAALWR